MILQSKTLEKLRLLINEETEYRGGPKLVSFFNALGFNDSYGQGFPSRWLFTDEKLATINGTPELDKCIRLLFAPVNFIGNYGKLDKCIAEFNQFLAFDKWKVLRNGASIDFAPAEKINFEDIVVKAEIKEDDFLNKEFEEITLSALGLDNALTEVLNVRLTEIKKCLSINASLSVIFQCGSTLEGILLGVAIKNPKMFNSAAAAPKDKEQKVKAFHMWTLSNLIDASCEVGHIKEDVKKFSHSLRDFRNYIHPYEQMGSGFNPDSHTAKISWQVLKAAIYQISQKKS